MEGKILLCNLESKVKETLNIYVRIPTTELYSSFRSANQLFGYLYASEIEYSLKSFNQILGTGKN